MLFDRFAPVRPHPWLLIGRKLGDESRKSPPRTTTCCRLLLLSKITSMFSKDSCCPYLVPFFSPLLESNHADLMYVVCPRLTIMQDFTLTFDRPFGVHTSRSYSETVMIL